MAEGRYIAYYRVSTKRQGASGLGLEAQKKAVLDYLNGGGWSVVGEYTEVETGKGSNALSKRPQLQTAIAHAKKVKAQLLIAKIDRLARNVHFVSGLMESKVNFRAVDMPDADPFMLHIYASVAEEEGRRISQRTKAALAAAKVGGKKLGTMGKVRARENKARAMASAKSLKPVIVELRKADVTSIRQIAEALNERSIPTPRGGRWHPTSVARLLARIG